MDISVIIPAYNAQATIKECLEGLKDSEIKPKEIILVDDNSTDKTLEIAAKYNIRIIKKENRTGANESRNIGALEASGDILLFLDSDVAIHKDTITNLRQAFESPEIKAVVGCYSTTPRTNELVTNFKNLWIRFSYLKHEKEIDWIFGAVSAIRKDAFIANNGFDNSLHAKHGVDDLELGKRIHAHNSKIILDHKVVVDHLKKFTLFSLLKNEFRRSKWFVVLAKDLHQVTKSVRKGFVNIYPNFIWATIISWPLLISLVLSFFYVKMIWAFFSLFIIYMVLNFKFLKYFTTVHGLLKAISIIAILFLDHITCGVGSIFGLLSTTKRMK